MLTNRAQNYYRQILKRHPNSYFAEDESKIIIGIDCEFLDANEMDFSEFKARFYEKAAKKPLCEYGGFFGVLAADFISLYEDIGICEDKSYEFPLFLFADARAYLIFEKNSKIYHKFGENEYFDFLSENDEISTPKSKFKYEILNDEKKEQKAFEDMVKRAKDYLLSGDIFQVVLSSQICVRSNVDSFTFYEELASQNPSPYMFHFPCAYGIVVGSSPELVLSVKNKELLVSPIAGTRNLSANSDKKALEKDLLSDDKELCEHKMLVDLARNDVSKFGINTKVANPFSIVSYQFVMHIVSDVMATLRDDASIFDAICAVFPAGTLSGAPKIRALQIINELESRNRGVYGGAIGFLKFNEDLLLAILIRSTIFVADKAFIASGAGIVADSVPSKEYAEICAKRRSLLNAFANLGSK